MNWSCSIFRGGPCPPLYAREDRVTSPSPSRVLLQSHTRYGPSSFPYTYLTSPSGIRLSPCLDHIRVRPLVGRPGSTRGPGMHARYHGTSFLEQILGAWKF